MDATKSVDREEPLTDRTLSTRAELRAATTTTGVHRLAFVDGIRGLAAVFVVISHCWDTVFHTQPRSEHTLRLLTDPLGAGRPAVAVFIVVSGFSIGLGAWRGGLRWPGGVRTYAKRRFTRIWPPYAAAVLISSAIALTVLSGKENDLFDQANSITFWGVVTHLVLVQDIVWRGPAGSTAFWSISVEFHIYFVFLLVMVCIRRWRSAWMPAVGLFVVLTVVTTVGSGNALLHWVGDLYPSLYALFIIGFMAGASAVAGVSFDERAWRRSLGGILVVGLLIIVLFHTYWSSLGPFNDIVVGPLVAFLITQLVLGRYVPLERVLSSKPLSWLGDCSYSVYLIHAVVIEAVWRVVVRPATASWALRLVLEIVLGVGASVIVARVFYLSFERPFMRRHVAATSNTRRANSDPRATRPSIEGADSSRGL